MTYQISQTEIALKATGKVLSVAPKSAYDGWNVYVRNEKTGSYRKVFGLSQENEYVQGENQGGWFHHSFDSREDAAKFGWKAYRWLNR
jgi:hypothetical protein